MDGDSVRPVVRRERIQPAHLGVGVERREQAEQVRDLDRSHDPMLGIDRDAAQVDRSSAHCLVKTFHRGELRRLSLIDEARAGVACDAGEHDRHGRHRHPQDEPTPVQLVFAPPE